MRFPVPAFAPDDVVASPAPVEPPAEPAAAEDFALDMFSGMDEPSFEDVVEDQEILEPPAPDGTPPASSPASPAPAISPAPPGEPPQPIAATTTPVAIPVAGTPPAQPTSAQPPSSAPPAQAAPQAVSPDQILATLDKEVAQHREAFTNALAQQGYQLSPEELSGLQENPEKTIPALLARVHVNVTSSILKVLSNHLPAQVNGLLQARTANQDNELAFWSANPGLNKANHAQAAMQAAKFVNQTEPGLAREVWIKKVGAMTAAMTGVVATAQPAAPQAQPAVHTPGRVVRQVQSPYNPAGATGAPAPPAPQRSEWDRITHLMELDEAGAFET